MLDFEEEGLNERSIIIIDGTDAKILSQSTCFDSKDGKPGACFYKSNSLSEGQRCLMVKVPKVGDSLHVALFLSLTLPNVALKWSQTVLNVALKRSLMVPSVALKP